MRRTTPLLCLLALLAAPAHGVDVEYPAPSGESTVTVDLLEDAGQTIDLHLDVAAEMDGGCLAALDAEDDALTALAKLRNGDAALDLSLLRRTVHETVTNDKGEQSIVEHIVFTHALSVDHVDLVAGTWSLALTVTDRDGASHDCSDERELVVEADDAASPVVSFPTAVDGVVRLASHQSVAPRVTDATLGRVEYRVDRMPPGAFFALKEPYLVKSQSFFPGENELTLRATDRAGNAPTVTTVKVVVDGDEPELVVDLLNRTTFYAGIPNPIVLNVTDESDYRVTVSFQGRDVVRQGPGGGPTDFRIGVPANATGEDLLQVRVVDAFGNRASFTRLLTVTQLTTDARIDEADAAADPVVLGEDTVIHVSLKQPKGVANVTFALQLDGKGMGDIEVPSRGSNETNLTVRLPPGRQELTLKAVAPDGVLHDAENLTIQVPVEVYLARVIVGDDHYHVRATPQGLPSGVLDPDGKTLPVELVERGSSSVYAFQAGNETYHWDPAGPNVQDFQQAEDVDDGDNESPGVGVVLLLGLLVVAVALRRR